MTKNQVTFLRRYRVQYDVLKKRYEDIEKSNLPNKDKLLEEIKKESEEIADKMITEAEDLK